MAELTLSFFGAFRAEVAGQPLVFSTHKIRALLAYLAVNPGPHWREGLATLLWGEFSDRDARRSVSRSLNRLRESLAPLLLQEPALLEADRQTIQLHLDPARHRVDVLRFEQLLNQCRRHPHEAVSACPACIQHLEEASQLCAGNFMAGFVLPDSPAFTEWQQARQESYVEQGLSAMHTLAACAVAVGDWERAQRFAQQQLSLAPWREEAHRQMMYSLAQCGQRSAALAQYERCQRILAEELGVEPDTETTALNERIKRGAAPHNLPAPTRPLIGQEAILTQITALLCDPAQRLLTLVGWGGIGKTELALAAARRLVGAFQDGVYFVSCLGIEGEASGASELLREAILSTLQGVGLLSREVGTAPQVALRTALRERHLLLILDNFEGLLDNAPTLSEWLTQAPTLHLLVTSREPLNLLPETVIRVPPLSVPSVYDLQSDEDPCALEAYSAVQLFVQAAQRVHPPFRLDPTNAGAVLQICQLVGGMPLALEMAAAWSHFLPCEQIATQIALRLDFLSAPYGDVPDHQRSLRAVFEHSWALLEGIEQQVLATLSVFAGSFTLAAAQAVLKELEPLTTGMAVMSKLAGKTLIRPTAPDRFELHPLVRRYAAEKLAARGEEASARTRHAAYYATLVQARSRSRWQAYIQVMESEIENVRSAWKWVVADSQREVIEQFLEGLFYFFDYKYWYQEGNTLFGEALQQLFGNNRPVERCEDHQEATLRIWLLIYQGLCSLHLNQPEQARALLGQGLALATAQEIQPALAWALIGLGLLSERWSLSEASLYLERALALCRALDDEEGMVLCSLQLGAYARERGEYHLARQFHEQNLLFCRRIDQQRGEVAELSNLSVINRILGAHEAAYGYAQEALALARVIDNADAEGNSLVQLIDIAGIVEGYPSAQRYFEALCVLQQRHGQQITLALAYLNLGRAGLPHRYWEEAQTHLNRAVTLFQEIDYAWGLASTLPLLGEAALALGKVGAAHSYLVDALHVAYATGSRISLLKSLLGWARLLAAQRIQPRAIELLALLLHHPALWYEDQQSASQLFAELTSGMSTEVVAAARAQGRTLNLEKTAATLLADAADPVVHRFATSRDSLARSFRTLR